MTARLAAIRPRLEKLVLMLSSPNSGEVVNAARAIEQTLQDGRRRLARPGSRAHRSASAITNARAQGAASRPRWRLAINARILPEPA